MDRQQFDAESEEAGFRFDAGSRLWFFGNENLLRSDLACIGAAFGSADIAEKRLSVIQSLAEELVSSGRVMVCGVHSRSHRRAALVALKWQRPRIVVLSGGFYWHLGENLNQEPIRAARSWSPDWNAETDLAISRRPSEKLPTFARTNPTIDRLILLVATKVEPRMKHV